MKTKKKIEVISGDIILMSNSDGTQDCALVLETGKTGIKMLTRSGISTFKTDDFLFNKDVVFSLDRHCKD